MRTPHRAVALYRRGPSWDRSLPLRAQAAIQEHFSHLQQLARDGLLEINRDAGPVHRLDDFVENSLVGVVVLDTDAEQALELCSRDPAVAAGTMRVEVHPWYV